MKEAFPHPKDDLISGIVSLPQEKRARLASGLTRQLVDGHTLVAQGLKQLGITHVYCVSGTPIRETFARCGEWNSPHRCSSSTGRRDDGGCAELHNWET
jgi:hypothetical protein